MTNSSTRTPASATNARNFRTFLLMRELAGREIGMRIALARKESGGMTQDELADLLSVTMRSVQNYEAGETIPWRHFKRLEEIFQKPLGWFLHGDSDMEPTSEERLREIVRGEVAAADAKLDRILELLEASSQSRRARL